MLSGWLHTSPSWLNPPRRGARWLLCPQLRVWSCSASHSRCGEKGSDPILYTWIIPMHRQPQGANARDVKQTDRQTFSHDCCGHLVLTVGLPHVQPIITLVATEKLSGRRLERRWPCPFPCSWKRTRHCRSWHLWFYPYRIDRCRCRCLCHCLSLCLCSHCENA